MRTNLATYTNVLLLAGAVLAGAGAAQTPGGPVSSASAGLPDSPAEIALRADGAAAAPRGPAQMPDLFNAYDIRPPWHVAGVDYAVGPNSPPGKDPATIRMAGVSVDTKRRSVRVTGDNIALDGYDFSLHDGYYLIVNGKNAAVTNSRFRMGTNLSYYLVQAYGNGLTLKYNLFDGTSTNPGQQSGLIAVYGSDPVIQYNLIENFGQHALEMSQNAGVTTTLDYRFNLIRNGGVMSPGAHVNYLQWGKGNAVNPVVAFNTTHQTRQVAQGEGFQTGGWPQSSLSGGLFAHNTMIAAGSEVALSFLANLSGGGPVNTGTARNNYFDTRAAYGSFYKMPKPGAWSFASNYDLRTGEPVSISGATQIAAPDRPAILSAVASANGAMTVSGTAPAGSGVTLFAASYVPVGTAQADTAGKWLITSSPLAPGAHALTAVAAGPSGLSVPSSATHVSITAR